MYSLFAISDFQIGHSGVIDPPSVLTVNCQISKSAGDEHAAELGQPREFEVRTYHGVLYSNLPNRIDHAGLLCFAQLIIKRKADQLIAHQFSDRAVTRRATVLPTHF